MSTGKLQRVGERDITGNVVSQSLFMKEVEKYVTTQFGLLYDLCHRHDIPIPPIPFTEKLESSNLLSASAQRRLEREQKKKSDRVKAGWITRRGVRRIMTKNPGINKTDAVNLYMVEQNRTRVEIPTSETAKTPSQKAWVSRLQNIIDDSDQAITWAEAHQIALSRFRGVRRKAG